MAEMRANKEQMTIVQRAEEQTKHMARMRELDRKIMETDHCIERLKTTTNTITKDIEGGFKKAFLDIVDGIAKKIS